MADANTVIQQLGQQLAQAFVDKAILEAELAEVRGELAQAQQRLAASAAERETPAE